MKVKSIINFKCMKCGEVFDFDVGKITFPPPAPGMRPKFEKNIQCKNCGLLTADMRELTEIGQTQLTELFLKNKEIDIE